MFDDLSERLRGVLGRLAGHGRITEADVDAAMREVRLALLEADVNFRVVKDFVARVRERAVGQDVLESLNAGQQVIKIVHEELTAILGAGDRTFHLTGSPAVVMLVGLQGSGKTTTSAKLARYITKQGRRPLLVAADPYRPAAVDQLQTLGKQIDIPVYRAPNGTSVPDIARGAHRRGARRRRATSSSSTPPAAPRSTSRCSTRSASLARRCSPPRRCSSSTRWSARSPWPSPRRSSTSAPVTGIVLTKIDGDARGGAALSITAVTGLPVKFLGTGERTDALEVFHPDRLAGRILGMGDVLTLIERAQENIDQKQAEELARKLQRNAFTLEDFLGQMQQLKKMGPIGGLLEMIPGMGGPRPRRRSRPSTAAS